ncbi:hypothetical protein NPIL_672861 [Nephila pilipes]|uniref:Uncharacterized protein n=1 Tax=Nephila pilipes TaxID=299642 RepID=A0A8X6N8M2_NEPPI|nr:hypothetical protein NPIL_672861 [Nephila pilipes]
MPSSSCCSTSPIPLLDVSPLRKCEHLQKDELVLSHDIAVAYYFEKLELLLLSREFCCLYFSFLLAFLPNLKWYQQNSHQAELDLDRLRLSFPLDLLRNLVFQENSSNFFVNAAISACNISNLLRSDDDAEYGKEPTLVTWHISVEL